MALTFPRTDIIAGLPIGPATEPFKPLWRQEVSRTANGVTLVKELGPLLWQANYTTVPMRTLDAGEVEADLLSLMGGIELFEGYDPRHPLPAADATTAIDTAVVYSKPSAGAELRIDGLPGFHTITKGDWVSIDDGTNLHLVKALETVQAGAGGLSPAFAVMPPIRSSVSNGDPVKLRYPCARFMIQKDSVQRIPRGPNHEVVSFSAIQVIE